MAVLLSEEVGAPLPAKEEIQTIWRLFRNFVVEYPEDLALVSMHQPANLYGIQNIPLNNDENYTKKPYLRWNYHGLGMAIDRLATGLQNLGARAGTPLISFMPNGAERMMAVFAANKLGCPFTAISPKNLTNMEEVKHMFQICKMNGTVDNCVIIAQDPSLVGDLNVIVSASDAIKVLVTGQAQGWETMDEVIRGSAHLSRGGIPNGKPDESFEPNDASVFFTSGTTSLPKGCRWAHPQLAGTLKAQQNLPCSGRGDKWASVLPNNHAYGHAMSLWKICSGTTVVYPGQAFDPQLMFAALVQERCTHVSLVPTMVTALIAVKDATGFKLPHLECISIGGSVVTPLVLEQCIQNLGASKIENVFGMTDGVYFSLGEQSDLSKYVSGEEVAVGKVMMGASGKVCAPGSTRAVPRNEVGELHYSGILNCGGYVGIGVTDDWYVDDNGKQWFKTGDQARMDEQGRVFVLGRYKDIVIRGGKNISCSAMEANLAKNPKLVPFNVQVVPAPDSIAGEVPVAVTEIAVSREHALEILETLRTSMGREYVPDEVLSAQELGMSAFPRTILGKVKKVQIAKIVKEFRAQREMTTNGVANSKMANDVRELWARAVGLPVERLTNDTLLVDFADSITFMRVRDRMQRLTKKKLSIVEIAEAGTIGNIIKLLESRDPEEPEAAIKLKVVQREGPPRIDDMVHLVEDPDLLDATKDAINKAIKPFGFSWNDVQEVMPAYDFTAVLATTGVMDSWNFKFGILPSKKLDKKAVRGAIETFLKINPLFASFLVWDDETLGSDLALHVTLRHDQKLFDAVIRDVGSVKSIEDLRQVSFRYPYPEHARFPGPLVRFLVYHVEEANTCGFIFNINHGIIDASYGQILLDDLERCLGSPYNAEAAMVVHPDYKVWADSYFSLRASPEARRAVKWHYNRLKTLKTHKKALWPKAPSRVPFDDADYSGPDGVQYSFDAPGIRAFRQQHRTVTAPVFAKAALALINTWKTGHDHALFSNLEAARTNFPFITKAMAERGQYEATDVAGPCIQGVVNLVQIKPDESVANFLIRMQEDQTNLTKYASAPLRDIISSLGDAGEMLPQIIQSQVYNWVPGMSATGTNPYNNFEVLAAVVRPQVGLAFNCGMGGPEGDTIFMHVRGDSLSDDEMLTMAKQIEQVVLWMVDQSRWNQSAVGALDTLSAQ